MKIEAREKQRGKQVQEMNGKELKMKMTRLIVDSDIKQQRAGKNIKHLWFINDSRVDKFLI